MSANGWKHPAAALATAVASWAAAFACLAPPAGAAVPLSTRLAQSLAVPGSRPASSGAIAVDLATGKPLFVRNPDVPLEPASNEKLTVSFAALVELGPAYRFLTQVLGSGSQVGAVWHGDLFLKGFGDPTLASLQLERLAAQLKRQGIRQVDGRVLGDESWFDGRRTAPDWKPSFYLVECPALSALSVDHGVYQGRQARRPALAAAGRFRQLLRKRGITTGAVGTGKAPASAIALAEVQSAPLRDVLQEMDRASDNFSAELLVKELGAEVGDGGTTAAGVAIVRRDLVAAGVPLAGVRLYDGSGLSLADRLTPRALAALLVAAWDDPALRDSLWRALPVAGVNGTLEDRMEHAPARGAVHAKTGTTDRASALAGYVRDRYAFAVLQNGRPVSATAARKAQDRFATALASISQ
jgi:D-alanyl-D-alanine carboxypeptidase/D-alanyl-D-alanine-endopeptidase (penicillin-binding protein 4)